MYCFLLKGGLFVLFLSKWLIKLQCLFRIVEIEKRVLS